MIAAYEAARGALVVKHQSIAAVRADIVERLDRPVLGPRDQHRCLRHLDRLDDVTTRLREPLDPSDAEPGALEDTLLLEFEVGGRAIRSEEHTSELQSLMRNSYAGFGLT